MSLLPDLGRKLWLKTELNPSPTIQRFIVPHLYQVKNMARPWLKPYLNLYLWQGKNQAGILRVTFAGPGTPNKFLMERLFSDPPQQHELGRFNYPRFIDYVNKTDSDITIVQADKNLIDTLPSQNSLRLPQFVTWQIDVQGSAEELRTRLPKDIRRESERLIRKHGYGYEISRSKQDFDHFYYEMYCPSIKYLHGELADLTSYSEAFEYFKHGWIYKILRQDEYIFGRLVYAARGGLFLKLVGMMNGDERFRRDGAQHASYYPILQEANKLGFKFVNFGLSAPFSGLNLFQYKRSWGATVTVVPFDPHQLWFHFHRITPGVTHFMQQNPLVCLNQSGKFYGLVVVDDPVTLDQSTLEKQRRLYLADGLEELCVCAITDLVIA